MEQEINAKMDKQHQNETEGKNDYNGEYIEIRL